MRLSLVIVGLALALAAPAQAGGLRYELGMGMGMGQSSIDGALADAYTIDDGFTFALAAHARVWRFEVEGQLIHHVGNAENQNFAEYDAFTRVLRLKHLVPLVRARHFQLEVYGAAGLLRQTISYAGASGSGGCVGLGLMANVWTDPGRLGGHGRFWLDVTESWAHLTIDPRANPGLLRGPFDVRFLSVTLGSDFGVDW